MRTSLFAVPFLLLPFLLFSSSMAAQDDSAGDATSATAETVDLAEELEGIESEYSRLIIPEVANRLGLTDEQRAQAQELMIERAQALKNSPSTEWAEIVQQSEQALKAILTPEQQALWPTLSDEVKIRFHFHFQQWEDVLTWLADEAGMQLVMDSPPEGTLNYTSQKEYTITEAIDLLNGILQTKGYTLIRHDNILMLFDLRQGKIPSQYLPKITPEQLDQRGKFEFVTVTFDLGRAEYDRVFESIRPFLGPFSEVTRMPLGNNMMITDTGGNLRIIQDIVDRLVSYAQRQYEREQERKAEEARKKKEQEERRKEQEEKKRKEEAERRKREAPVLDTHTVGKLDVSRVLDVLEQVVKGEYFRLEGSNQINAYTSKENHEKIDEIIASLEAGATGETAPVVEVYPLEGLLDDSPQNMWYMSRMMAMQSGRYGTYNPYTMMGNFNEELVEALEEVVPDSQITLNQQAKKLVVFGPPDDQEKVSELIEKLRSGPSDEDAPVVKVYKFTDENLKISAEVGQTLEDLVPTAQVNFDAENNRILVIATAKEHDLIQSTIDYLETSLEPEEERKVVLYPVTQEQFRRFMLMYRTLSREDEFDDMLMLSEGRANQLTIWATEEQHERLKRILDQLHGVAGRPTDDSPEAAMNVPQLEIYPLQKVYASTAMRTLVDMVPGVDINIDTYSNSLLVYATPKVQQEIRQAIEQMESQLATRVKFFPLEKELSAEVMASIRNVAPRAEVTMDQENMRLMVYGKKSEVENITEVIEAATAGEIIKDILKYYPIEKQLPTSVSEQIQEMVPQAEVNWEEENQQYVVLAPEAVHTEFEKLLTEAVAALPEEDTLKFYPVAEELPSNVMSYLDQLLPDLEINWDGEEGRYVVIGKMKEHEKFAGLLSEIKTALPEVEELEFYPADEELPSNVMSYLEDRLPQAEINWDGEDQRYVVIASPEDQSTFAEMLAEVQVARPAEEQLHFYPIDQKVTDEFVDLLKEALPEEAQQADIRRDENHPKMLVVRAKPAIHSKIKLEIDRLLEEMPEHEENELRLYTVTTSQRQRYDSIQDTLKEEIGDFRLIQDNRENVLSIWATPSQHDRIAQFLEELDKGLATDKQQKLIFHKVRVVDTDTITSLLGEFYPDVRITEDEAQNRLILRVHPDQADAVKMMLEEIDSKAEEGPERYFAAYEVQGFYTYDSGGTYQPYIYFLRDIQRLVPNAEVSMDRYTRNLIVYGTEEEHEIVKKAVQHLKEETSAVDRFGVFPLREANYSSVLSMMRILFPRVRASYDTDSEAILAYGSKTDLTEVEAFMRKVDPKEPGPNDPVIQFYQLEKKPTEFLLEALAEMVPEAQIVSDEEGKQLMVVATPAEHKIIEHNVENIVGTFTAPEEPMLFIYQVTSTQRKRFEAFLDSAGEDLESIEIVEDEQPGQISIWAKPTEHELISQVLVQLAMASSEELGLDLRSFNLTTVESQTATDVLSEMHPEVNVVPGDTGNRLLVWGTKSELEKVARTIEEIDSPITAENQPRYESFTIKSIRYDSSSSRYVTLRTLTENLSQLVPEAEFFLGSKYYRLIAWGTPEELEIVRGALDKIGYSDSEEVAATAEVYTPKHLDSLTLYRLLYPMVPDATITFNRESDEGRRNLIVFATPENHELIKTTIDKLEAQAATGEAPELRTFPVNLPPSNSFIDGLEDIAPRAEIVLDEEERTILAIAKPTSLDRIGAAIDQYNQMQSADDMPQFESFSIGSLYMGSSVSSRYYSLRNLQDSLRELAPKARIMIDGDYQKLIAFGSARDLEIIRNALAKLNRTFDSENQPQIRFYTPKTTLREEILQGLRDMAPAARFSYDEQRNELTVIGTPAEQQLVDDTIAKINEKATEAGTEELVYESVQFFRPNLRRTMDRSTMYLTMGNLREHIQEVVPGVRVLFDSRLVNVVLFGSREEVDKAKKVVQAISRDHETNTVEVYPLTKVDDYTAYTVLTDLLNNQGDLAIDRESGDLVAYASPQEHKIIAEALTKMQREGTENRTLQAYPLASPEPDVILETIESMYPGLKITLDERSNRLLIWATPEQHAHIGDAIEEANGENALGMQETYEVYSIPKMYYRTAEEILETLMPEVEVFADPMANKVTVRASEQEHAEIASIFEQVQAEDDEYRLKMMVYPIGDADPETVEETLRGLLPDAQSFSELSETSAYRRRYSFYRSSRSSQDETTPYFKVDPETKTAIVLAPKEFHEEVTGAIEALAATAMLAGRKVTRAYYLEERSAYTLMELLEDIVPGAQFTPGTNSNELVAVATEEDQQKIAEFVEQLRGKGPTGARSTMKIHHVPPGTQNVDRIARVLRYMYPDAYPSMGWQPDQIVVWGPKATQEKIEQLLVELAQDPPEENQENYALYTLKNIPARTAFMWLREAYPDTRMELDPRGEQALVVYAPKIVQLEIGKMLEILDVPIPEDVRMMPKIYPFTERTWSVRATYLTLREAFPDARFSLTDDRAAIMAVASQNDHQKIANFLDSLSEGLAEQKPILEFYSISKVNLQQAITFLQRVAPYASIAPGGGSQLFVWATPSEHEDLQRALAKMESFELEEIGQSLRYYDVSERRFYEVLAILRNLVPGAILVPGEEMNKMLAWGSDTDHQKIEKALSTMEKAFPDRFHKMYHLKHISSWLAMRHLEQIFERDVYVSDREDTHQLIVFASESSHEEVAKILEEIDVEPPEGAQNTSVVYDMSNVPRMLIGYVIGGIRTAAPEVVIFPSETAGHLVIWGRPTDQEKVAKIVEQIKSKQMSSIAHIETYSIDNTTATAATPLLQELAPNAKFGYGTDPHMLLVWANMNDHLKIRQAVEEMNEDDPNQAVPKVYRFQRASISSAYTSIQAQMPNVRITYDQYADMLLITATPEEHEKVEMIVEELDKLDPETQVTVQIHPVATADTRDLYSALSILYSRDPRFLLRFDPHNKSLVAMATPQQHRYIDDLIQQIEAGGLADPKSELKIYSLKNIASYTAIRLLRDLFDDKGIDIDLSTDYYSNQMVVYTRPEHHQLIQDVLDSLRTEEKQLEVFQLEFVEPMSARTAIYQLFADESYDAAPSVEIDEYSNQMYVRGTPDQLKEVRNTLIKMGEVNLPPVVDPETGVSVPAPQSRAPQGRNDRLRVLKFDGNPEDVIEEIQKLWPQVSGSQLQVIRQDEMLIQTEENPSGGQPEKAPQENPDRGSRTVPEAPTDADSSLISGDEIPLSSIEEAQPSKADSKPEPEPEAEPTPDPETESKPGAEPQPKEEEDLAKPVDHPSLKKEPAESTESKKSAEPAPEKTPPEKAENASENPPEPASNEKPSEKAAPVKPAQEKPAQEKPASKETEAEEKAPTKQEPEKEKSVENSAGEKSPEGEADKEKAEQEPTNEESASSVPLPKGLCAPQGPSSSRGPAGPARGRGSYSAGRNATRSRSSTGSRPAVVPSSTVEGYASKLGQGGTATDGNEPVYLIVGEDGTLTIASDNTRALNQLEQLVKRVNSRVVFEGHDYTIYTIKNTSASFVAQKLQLLLSDRMQGSQGYSSRYSRYSRSSRYGRYGSRSTRLEILPDETTNTIYVKGPKNVRREVEELIAMLDVEELPGMAAVQKPVKVQIENTQAMRILQQILSVYQQRLMATRLPGGVYPRISVDTLTNSIVIIAPDNLAEDIKEYAKELDEEMLEQPSRKLHVLPLEKVNTNVVQQALQAIYQSAASGYPTRMPYGGGMVMPSNPRSPYANRRNR